MIEPSELSAGETINRPTGVHWAVRIHRILFIARRYWWIAALTAMIGVGLAAYKSLHQVTHYYSSSRMIISGRLDLSQGDVYSEEAENFFGTQVALMQSPAILNRAVEQVGTSHPDIAPDYAAVVEAYVEPRTSIFDLKVTSNNADYSKLLLDAIMDTYLADKRERKNQITDEGVSAITGEITRLNAEIQKDEQDLLDFQKQNDVVFIEEQSSSSAAYLVELNSELARLNKERDLLLMESKDPLVNSGYNGKSENTALNPDAPPSKASDPTTSQNILPQNSDPISEQEDRIEKLKISSDQLGIYLKDKHPKMIDLANQIDREQKFLEALKDRNVTAQDAYREDLGLRIKNLESQIETANANSLKLSESLGAYQQLKNKLNRDEALYNQLALSIQNVDFNKSLDQEDIVILEAASKARPVLLDTALRLAYGFEGGLAAGMALIYFVYRLDDKIDSASQLEENFDLPILGQIPRVPADKQTKRVTLLEEGDQRHEYLEYHCHLRSAILFQSFEAKPMTTYVARTHAGRLFPNMVWIDEVTAYGPCPGGHLHTSNTGEHDCRIKIDNVPKMYCVHTSCRNEIEAANQALQLGTPGAKLRSLMICSAVPGEGKSTLAGNMAIVLAYSGLRVLLIDADLRRGILHTLFEVQANPGLSNYVMKEVSWREVVHETKVANLSLLPRGKSLHRAGDLLLSSAVDSLLQESTTAFDLVLWDSPPLLAAHDAANLCSKMDGILFVARFRFSSIISIRSALEDLSKRNAKILGFVLNATEHSQPGYSDKYRYKEYYGVTPAAD